MNVWIVVYVDHRGLLTIVQVQAPKFIDAYETFKMVAHREIISISKSFVTHD